MTGSESAFVAVGAVGFLLLLITLLLGEFGHGLDHGLEHSPEVSHDVEVPHDFGTDLQTPSWLSFRVIAAAAVGFGAFGFVAERLGLPGLISWPVAAVGFLSVGAGTFFLVLKPMAKQQYNSLMSRYNYVGRTAVVTLDILPGGTGQVTFQDRQGARVTQTATSDLPEAVAKGARVQIVALAAAGVVVHRNAFSD